MRAGADGRASSRFASWRTAQATAILRRGIERVAVDGGMISAAVRARRARRSIAPSLLRIYGLRSAIIFVVMILATRRRHVHAARGGDRGSRHRRAREAGRRQRADDRRRGSTRRAASPSRRTAISTSPTRTTTSSSAPMADAAQGQRAGAGRRHQRQDRVLRRQRPGAQGAARHAGRRLPSRRTATSSSPTRTTIASAASTSRRASSRRSPDRARTATTATTSRRPRRRSTRRARSRARPNGDIYIADTLNYRVRMVDAQDRPIHTVAGDGTPGDDEQRRRRRPRDRARTSTCRATCSSRPTATSTSPTCTTTASAGWIATTHIITTVAGSGTFGTGRRRWPGDRRRIWPGRPASRSCRRPAARSRIFIADYYNEQVRAVGPDGIMRNVSDEGRVAFGAPSRVAFALERPEARAGSTSPTRATTRSSP